MRKSLFERIELSRIWARVKTALAPLAHLLLGSVIEAALMIANSDTPDVRRTEVGAALDDLQRGLE